MSLNIFKGAADDAAKAGEEIVASAEQAGEKLAGAATANLKDLIAAGLDMADDYEIVCTFTVAIRKKATAPGVITVTPVPNA